MARGQNRASRWWAEVALSSAARSRAGPGLVSAGGGGSHGNFGSKCHGGDGEGHLSTDTDHMAVAESQA